MKSVMLGSIAALVMAAITTSEAKADYLTLNCRLVESEGRDMDKWYRSGKAPDEDTVIMDGLMSGVVGFFMSPHKTWVIDQAKGEITSPETDGVLFTITPDSSPGSINGWRRSEAGNHFGFRFNQVTSRLTLTQMATPDTVKQWTHGTMPTHVRDEMACVSRRVSGF